MYPEMLPGFTEDFTIDIYNLSSVRYLLGSGIFSLPGGDGELVVILL